MQVYPLASSSLVLSTELMYIKDQEFSYRKAVANPNGGNVHYMVIWKKGNSRLSSRLPGQITCGLGGQLLEIMRVLRFRSTAIHDR